MPERSPREERTLNEECCVCLEDLTEGIPDEQKEAVIKANLTQCKHTVCTPCLILYCDNIQVVDGVEGYFCPVCRIKFTDETLKRLPLGANMQEGQRVVYTYYPDGRVHTESYYEGTYRHREHGPAYLEYYENRNKKSEGYYKNGQMHREDGPAWINYREDGQKEQELY
jgi:hypothetical protein